MRVRVRVRTSRSSCHSSAGGDGAAAAMGGCSVRWSSTLSRGRFGEDTVEI